MQPAFLQYSSEMPYIFIKFLIPNIAQSVFVVFASTFYVDKTAPDKHQAAHYSTWFRLENYDDSSYFVLMRLSYVGVRVHA